MPAAGKKTIGNPGESDPNKPYTDITAQELQNELSS
jgi:hypothetical protein